MQERLMTVIFFIISAIYAGVAIKFPVVNWIAWPGAIFFFGMGIAVSTGN